MLCKNARRVAAFALSLATASLFTLSPERAAATSLREAVQKAVHENPAVRASQADRRAAGYSLRQAQGRLLPSLDVQADVGRQKQDKPNSLAPEVNNEWLTRRQASVTVRQILFDGFDRANDIYRAASRLDATAHRVMERAELIGLEAVEAYIDVRRHRALLGAAQQNIARHENILGLVRARLEGGRSAVSEIDQTEERIAASRGVLAELRQALLEAEAKYRRVVGDTPRQLQQVGYPAGLPRDRRAAVEAALRTNPAIHAADADIDTARFEASRNDAQYMPEIALEGTAKAGRDVDGVLGRNDELVGKVVLSWNLFNGLQTTNRSRELSEQLQRAHADRDERRLLIAEQVERAYAAYQVGAERVQLFRQQVAKSNGIVTAYRDEYELQKRSLLDVLDSENALFSSRFQLISVEAVRLFSAYQLLAQMGRLLQSLNVAAPVETVADHREQAQRPFGIMGIEIEPLRQ